MTTIDVIIVQTIATTSGLSTQVVRAYETGMMPQVGHKVRERSFGDDRDRVIEDVVIDYEAEECYAYLATVTLDDAEKEDLRDYAKEYVRHGWEWPRPL
ncbi:hypothetical protein JNUCC31_09090 [Paenibacillus sp. JNUCC31]|uniref:hypothetical protein n=1 Tax=Paenibacillus sp. JNUCC-31 TaxID=2777983 RepID=UPI001786AC67|nr:hypothetical protein [Paenibacillus sp. JNUCC-31]QOS81004.1 hypothetical protein JNUCC31_09090 [Paenibacillus sp. JNUCC-31]